MLQLKQPAYRRSGGEGTGLRNHLISASYGQQKTPLSRNREPEWDFAVGEVRNFWAIASDNRQGIGSSKGDPSAQVDLFPSSDPAEMNLGICRGRLELMVLTP